MTMTTLIINILAFGTLLSSIFSITSKNPVISVIFLISTFVQAALYLILIGVHFVGISYIVIYVGAIAVLFLFVIMMINIKLTDILETGSQYTKNLPLAIAIGSLFIFIFFTIIPFDLNNVPALSLLLDKMTYLNSFFSTTFNTTEGAVGIIGDKNLEFIDFINSLSKFNKSYKPSISDKILTEFQQIEVLGHSLYTYGAVLLITLSVILLLAMFATIIISGKNKNKNINK